jgi:hypothetical protein
VVDRFVGLAYSNSVVQLVPIHTVISATGTKHYPQPDFSALTPVFSGDFTENRKKT